MHCIKSFKIFYIAGKTLESERKRKDVRLVHKWEGRYSAKALISRPNFHSRSIFAEDLVAIQLSRTEISIKKPLYVGMSILDISKEHMYSFHYSFMKEKFGNKCKVMYTDTDSLVYNIETIDPYEIIRNNLDRFDTSDYKEDNIFQMPRVHGKFIGLFKDECNGCIMALFIGLRSKMYAIRIFGKEPIKKAKGIKNRVVKVGLDVVDYEQCLFNKEIINIVQNNIRSRLHVVRTERQKKIGLSPHDNKRYILPDGISTHAWGHYSIPEENIPETMDIEVEDMSNPEQNLPNPEQDLSVPVNDRYQPVNDDEIVISESSNQTAPRSAYKQDRLTPELIAISESEEESPPKKRAKVKEEK